MTWQTEVIECIRVTINDMDEPYTYTDTRLERMAIVSAVQVLNDAEFQSNYIVDLNLQTITPDPTDKSVNAIVDNPFIALVALKACCLIVKGDLKKYAQLGGIQVTDGPSSVNTAGLFNNYLALSKQFCEDYAYLKMNYKYTYAWENAQAIITATTVREIYGNLDVLPY